MLAGDAMYIFNPQIAVFIAALSFILGLDKTDKDTMTLGVDYLSS